MKKFGRIVVAVPVAAMLLLTGCGSQGAANTEPKDEGTKLSFKVGTYTASADGKNGPVKVEVVFSENKIDSVTVKEHKETAGLSDPAIKDIPAKIVELQSLDVDVVTGATLTSQAIKYAVADAVKQSAGESSPLLNVDLARNPADEYFKSAAAAIEKPKAVNGVIEVKTYDELKRALGYNAYIVNPDTKAGKFVYVDGSAADGDTIKLVSDLTAGGEKENPKNADGSDKADVVTGSTVLVTNNVTIDGNGKTIKGDGYPTFMFTGQLEDFGSNPAIEATLKNITIDGAAYTAKIGGTMFVAGAATVNLEDSEITNGKAQSAKLAFNGGAAVYVNSEGLAPEVAVLNAKNTKFTNNSTANGAGAAVMAYNGQVNLVNCTLTGNKSTSPTGSGGAVSMRGNTKLVIDGSTITGNEATVAGGGVYLFDGESPQKPGAKLTSKTDATIKNSTIKDNKASVAVDVAYGRYYSDEFTGDKAYNGLKLEGNTIGDFKDLLFADLERTKVAK